MSATKRCVVLLSGGLDSATVLAIAKRDGFSIQALSFDYGQRHALELDYARRVANAAGVDRHLIARIDLRIFGGSALTSDIPVPKDRELESNTTLAGHKGDIPVTYVPARNTIFLSYALAFAEVSGARDIFIGVNSLDYSGYPDCRPEYIAAFENLAQLATRSGVENSDPIKIHAPLLHMGKKEIIQTGATLGVDYSLTSSCYDPQSDGRACGRCDACQLRLRGFAAAGMKDPATYAAL